MNRNLLEYCIARAGYSITTISKRVGVSRTTFYKKLNSVVPFNHTEICVLIVACHLTPQEIIDIFFAKVVAQ